jgi:hypothetical protein
LTTVDRTWVELEEKAEVAEVAGEAEAEVDMSRPPACFEDFLPFVEALCLCSFLTSMWCFSDSLLAVVRELCRWRAIGLATAAPGSSLLRRDVSEGLLWVVMAA